MKNYLRPLSAIVVVASLFSIVAGCASQKTAPLSESEAAAKRAADAWAKVPEILKHIVPPTFPDRNFDITTFGAVGDGQTDCTKAFADAIAACNKSGGGHVVVPTGKFLTGPIHLKSYVDLHVTKEGTVLFTTNVAAYLPVVFTRYECTEVMNYSPLIYAFEQHDIAITGEGTLDSQANQGEWHSWKSRADSTNLVNMGNHDVPVSQRVFGEGHFLRPYFIQPTRCQNILIQGVKILGSPMWVISPLYCNNITIQGVTVEATGPNTDGCDPDSSSNILIKDCNFSDGDDCIAIKSGRDRDGHRVNIPSRNLIIQNCHFKAGHGGVSCGSETSGGIENVYAENCSFDSPNLDMAIRLKTNPARGGYIRNVYVRNCEIKTATNGIHLTLRYTAGGSAREGQYIPEMKCIDVRNCHFANLLKQSLFVEGYDDKIKISDVTVSDCVFDKAKIVGPSITNAVNIHLFNNSGAGWE